MQDSVHIAEGAAQSLVAEPALYFDRLTRDVAAAAEGLTACRSPLEALAVQQRYALARSQAWLDSGYRVFERCLDAIEGLPANGPAPFVLPD